MGLLEGEEIEKIVSYYSGVRLLENFRRELLEVERDKAKEIKTLWLGIYYKNLKKIMSDRKEALKYIKERGEN